MFGLSRGRDYQDMEDGEGRQRRLGEEEIGREVSSNILLISSNGQRKLLRGWSSTIDISGSVIRYDSF